MKNAICPVCKRQDDKVQLIYVPLGHGMFCRYICCECLITFPWGSNKFGDITKPEQVKGVCDVMNCLLDDTRNLMEAKEHADFRETKAPSPENAI